MTNFYRLLHSPHVSEDFSKRLCFLNNVRSKYLTIFLILLASVFTFYDIFILQKVSDSHIFLLHIKADIIFLVFSFIFALYIFYNQVSNHHKIKNHHKYIHGIISLFMLSWSVFKSVILIKFEDGDYSIAITCILASCILYIFPLYVYLSQLLFTFVFAVIISLLYNITFHEIINNIMLLSTILVFSMIISRYIYNLQIKILIKEKEAIRYRKI
ncbi:MAG TPA: hypothetical protein DCG75_00210 [Bacteroidales bacterium]|nr:hypothetical protein [Bacteroidales bacterium]